MKAIGLIETIGFVSAVEGLDAALKSANVEAMGFEFVGSGIVTVKIRGDVGAVKASIEAAEAAVNKVGTLRASHVISRTSDEVLSMIDDTVNESNDIEKEEDTKEDILQVQEVVEEEIEQILEDILDEPIEVEEIQEEKEKIIEEISRVYTKEELHGMKVSELRNLARTLKTNLTRKKIKFAKKDELIISILEVIER